MPSCFVCGRSRTSSTKHQNITFHRFSTDQKIREKWYDFLRENGLDVGNITMNSLICSSHFEPCLFIKNKRYRILSKTAVPSIKILRVKNSKTIHPEKKVFLPRISTPILDVNRTLVKISTSEIDIESSITSDKELPQLDVSMKSNINRQSSPTCCVIENSYHEVFAKHIDCEGVSLLDNIMLSNFTSLNTTVEDNNIM